MLYSKKQACKLRSFALTFIRKVIKISIGIGKKKLRFVINSKGKYKQNITFASKNRLYAFLKIEQ